MKPWYRNVKDCKFGGKYYDEDFLKDELLEQGKLNHGYYRWNGICGNKVWGGVENYFNKHYRIDADADVWRCRYQRLSKLKGSE